MFTTVPVFYNEDTVYLREDRNRMLLVGRPAPAQPSAPSLVVYTPQRKFPGWDFYADPFISVVGVQEYYGSAAASAPPPPIFGGTWMVRPALLHVEAEEFQELEIRRSDTTLIHMFRGRYAPQIIPFEQYVQDFCDDPWLEWVHPGAKHGELFQLAFSPPPPPIRGQQFSFLFYQAPNWKLEAEPDTADRRINYGIMIPYPHPPRVQPPPTITVVPNFVGLFVNAAVPLAASVHLTLGTFNDPYYVMLDPLGLADPNSYVIAQSLPVGDIVPINTTVFLTLATPDASGGVTYNEPNTVIGSTQFP